jgi:hypothetical protein
MGTRGNKRSLIRPLFLRKYKSLVAPCHRSPHDEEQLLRWAVETYNPPLIGEYEDWLILLESDLLYIQSDDGTLRSPSKEKKGYIIEKDGRVVSPYFKHYK